VAVVNRQSELHVVFAEVGGGHAGQGFGVENLPRRAVHGEAVEAAAAGDVSVTVRVPGGRRQYRDGPIEPWRR
jgi:hypothetical protein